MDLYDSLIWLVFRVAECGLRFSSKMVALSTQTSSSVYVYLDHLRWIIHYIMQESRNRERWI